MTGWRVTEVLSLTASAAILCSCVSFADLPMDLQMGANCLTSKLSGLPGIFAVRADAASDQNGPFAMIHYSFRDHANRERNVRFGLHWYSMPPTGLLVDAGEELGPFAGVQENPVFRARIDWKKECGIEEVLITAGLGHLPARG